MPSDQLASPSVRTMRLLCCAVFVFVLPSFTGAEDTAGNTENNSWIYTTIRPYVYYGNEKQPLNSSKDTNGHLHHLTVTFELHNKNYTVNLHLNRELIPNTFSENHQNGKVINASDIEVCQYQGSIQGISNSWAAISTCDGLRGIFFDGNEVLHIRKQETGTHDIPSFFNEHILYKQPLIAYNGTCGYSEATNDSSITADGTVQRRQRLKRSTNGIKGPSNANGDSRYVELVLVVDNTLHWRLQQSRKTASQHCLHLINIVNALYAPLNIFIVLVGVIVWSRNDQIYIQDDSRKVLDDFLRYRQEELVKKYPNDNAQLLTGIRFKEGIIGKAYPHSMCTYQHSGAVTTDDIDNEDLVAATIAHEMGHNFGMKHDVDCCQCERCCIMGESAGAKMPTKWSPCNLQELDDSFYVHLDYCLLNKPLSIYQSPHCGNGFVESDEQCDCGLEQFCDNPCCDPSTCLLYQNASCATGSCCDLQTCTLKGKSVECRSSASECDLPEYCDGQTEYCPDNVFKMDGNICKKGEAFCYQGSCTTHTEHCQKLWGNTAMSLGDFCYENNLRGTNTGHCGYNPFLDAYSKCNKEDIYCGAMQCSHQNEKLEFGMDSYARISKMKDGDKNIKCISVTVDLGVNVVQPGLVPNGAKCGHNKMCMNQSCISVQNTQSGTCSCNGNGICNSLGQCHCDIGYAPPFCYYSGLGGSVHSNAAIDPNARYKIRTALYVIFLGVLPVIFIIFLARRYNIIDICNIWNKGLNSSSIPVTASEHQNAHNTYEWKGAHQTRDVVHVHREQFTRSPRPTRPAPKAPPIASAKLDIKGPTLVSTTNNKMLQILHEQHESNALSTDVTENPSQNQSNSFLSSVGNFAGSISNRLSFSKKRTSVNKFTAPETCIEGAETSNMDVKVKHTVSYTNQPKKIRKLSTSLSLKIKQEPVRERLVETSDSCHSSPEVPRSETFKSRLSASSTSTKKSIKERKNIDPYKRTLLGTSDSCPSTPETPPTDLFSKTAPQLGRPSVASLVSKLEKA